MAYVSKYHRLRSTSPSRLHPRTSCHCGPFPCFRSQQTAFCILRQDVQLSQRPRDASCHWIFCLVTQVTQGHSKWHCWVGRVLVPISIFIETVCMLYRFWDIQRQKTAWPWNWGMGHSRSLKMAPFDRSYTTFYWTAIASIAVYCNIFNLFDVESSWSWKSH